MKETIKTAKTKILLVLTAIMALIFACGVMFSYNSLRGESASAEAIETRATNWDGFPLENYSGYERVFSENKTLTRNANLTVLNKMNTENVDKFSYSLIVSTTERTAPSRQWLTLMIHFDHDGIYSQVGLEIGFDGSYHYVCVMVNHANDTVISEMIDLPSSDRVVGIEYRLTEKGFYVYWKGVKNEGGQIYELLKSSNSTQYLEIYNVLKSGKFITCDGNGDNYVDDSSTYTVKEKGSCYNVSSTPVPLPETPTKEGYTFAGWFYGKGDQGHSSCVAYDNEPIFEDTDLHAHWQVNSYTVTYDCTGGHDIDSVTVNYGSAAPTPTPTRTGYRFIGWTYADGTAYNGAGITGNTILYATWEAITFEVNFYVDNELYAQKTVAYGSTLGVLEEEARRMSLRVLSVKCGNEVLDDNSIVVDNCSVQAEKMSEPESALNTIRDNLLPIIGGIVGAVVLISLVSVISGVVGKKR